MTRKPRSDHAVHNMIHQTARELAGTWYEEMAHDNEFYRLYRNQKFFIQRAWQMFVPVARSILVDMLNDPGSTEYVKEKVFEALMLDGAMNPPREHAEAAAAEMSLLN